MHRSTKRPTVIAVLAAVVVIAGGIAAAAGASTASSNSYVVHNLVSDQPGKADHVDPNLVNGWGIAAGPTSPWWVSDNGTNVSTLYNGSGVAQFPPTPLVVGVEGAPTGVVFNGGPGFVVSDKKGHSGPSFFIFATESGTIRGWNPAVPPPPLSTHAFPMVFSPGAVYKGLAIFRTGDGGLLYATDFHNGRVDVFDRNFHRVTMPGAFVDPNLPTGFAPFGIQNINGNIFVTYAKQDADKMDELHGPGLGLVDEYSTTGVLIRRVATGGDLNAPWGMAMAPSDFGQFSGDLLVGNFGNGRINAFEPQPNGSFVFRGQLRGANGQPIAIDGLWGIGFGNGTGSGDINDLYFAAGPDDESHGLFGEVEAAD